MNLHDYFFSLDRLKTLLKEWAELVHHLIGYIGSVDDHLTSSSTLHPPANDVSSNQDTADKDTEDKTDSEEMEKGDGGGEEEE